MLIVKPAFYTIEEEVLYESIEKYNYQKPIGMRKTWKLFGIIIKSVVSNHVYEQEHYHHKKYEDQIAYERPDVIKGISKNYEEDLALNKFNKPDYVKVKKYEEDLVLNQFNKPLKPNSESINSDNDKPSCSDLV